MGTARVWLRRLLWLVGAVLLLAGIAWLGVPPLLKWQAQERLTDWLGRTVSVGRVEFSPWNLRLDVTDLAVAAAPGAASQAPQLQLGAIRADIDARSLLHLAPIIGSLEVDAPRARLTRTAAGHYDVDDLLERLASRPDAAPGEPQRFAIYNLVVRDGEFAFDDQPAGRVHHLSGLQLTLPFVSNLAADVQVKVEPRVAFTLNGAVFDSGAQALPFSPERNGTLSLQISGLDLAPYLGYQPAALPVHVQRGKVSIDLGLDFAAPAKSQARVGIHGVFGIEGLAIAAADGAALAEVDRLSLTLKDVRPLAREAKLGALKVEGLVVHVARSEAGELSVTRLWAPSAAAPEASSSAAAGASAPPMARAPSDAAWQLGLDTLAVSNAQVIFDDAAVQPHSAFALAELNLDAQQLQLPMRAPTPFALHAVLRPQDQPGVTLATVALDGQASGSKADVNVALESVSLAALAPYVNLAAGAKVAGTGALRAKIAWAAASGDTPQQLVATIAELGLDKLKAGVATGTGGDIVDVASVKLADAEIDLAATKIAIAKIELERPDLKLDRSAKGAWNVLGLAGATALSEVPRAGARAAASVAWQVALPDVRIDGGRIRLNDAAPTPPESGKAATVVRLDFDRLHLQLSDVRLDGARLVSQPYVALSARVRAMAEADRDTPPGTLKWRGRFGIEPFSVRGVAGIERFPAQTVQAYVPHDLGLYLERAGAGFDGNVAVRQSGRDGLDIDADGDVLLSDVMLMSVPVLADEHLSETDRELLSWQSFDLKRVKLALRPGTKPKLAIGDATLSDFFMRLILTQEGRFNLRDVTERGGSVPAPAGDAASAPVAAGGSATATAAAPAADAGRLPVDLDLGGLALVDGRIDYSDRFVKPNYSAALTDLQGRIGAFDSTRGEPATLELDGRVAGTGVLEISGKLRPGELPRDLDITATAHDIELAPLSPYARKYAGYAIERGKLSANVHYKVSDAGRLEASHQLILNQLTFGEHVDSPDATKLPVLLAVSLLKDANGVIDINLPVSGTLSDPQFSLGGVIWRVIVNLLTKAITAPFSLLAGAGGHDMSVVAFAPGTSVPTAEGAKTLDKVAKALSERPALKLTITGEADPVAEHEALLRAMLDTRLEQEQRREALHASGKASEPDAATAITGNERARLIEAVYKKTDLPDKPRNLIGMQADVPTEKMESMLLEQMSVSPEAMRELALHRGVAVRDALAAKGLATSRLFLGAPEMHSDANAAPARAAASEPTVDATSETMHAMTNAGHEAKGGASWTPRAKLDLSVK